MKNELTNWKVIKIVLKSYIRTVGKTKFTFIVLFGLFLNSIVTYEPFFFARIISELEKFYETKVFDIEAVGLLMVLWFGFIILIMILTYIYDYILISKTALKNYINETSRYSQKIISMSFSEYLSKQQGKIYKIFDRGVENKSQLLFFIFLDFYKNIVSIIIVIFILFIINVKLTLFALSMLPIMLLLGYYFMNNTMVNQRELNEEWEGIFGVIGNIFTNFGLTKILTLETSFYKQINNKLGICYDKQTALMKQWRFSSIYTYILVMISRLLVLGYGTYLISKGEISLATLFLFFGFINWIYFPLSFIFAKMENLQEWLTAIKKFYSEFNDLETEEEGNVGYANFHADKQSTNNVGIAGMHSEIVKENNGYAGLRPLQDNEVKGSIEFKNVNFGYTEDRKILKNLSFKIKPGEKIAFVGNTGAGKSTIINLIFRLWDISEGKILLDGIDINNINKKSLRGSIGLVAQDNSLFNLSIKENLLFAKPKANDEEIKEALKNANAGFVYELKFGIDTIIGERGLKLSGGEKQRISIARLFLKNPEIIILDEATSALDNKTEKLIQKSLDKLLKGRTSVIIAHRLSTIQNVDKIFLLENGQIIEFGSYNDLIIKGGKFHDLVNPEHLIIN